MMVEERQPWKYSLLRGLTLFFNDLVRYKIFGSWTIKKEKANRTKKIINTIIKLMSKNTPYVIDGKWQWCQTEEGFHPALTIVFPTMGFICMVWGPESMSWMNARPYCKNKKEWEFLQSIMALVESRCKLHGFHYLSINWDEPIDETSLSLRTSALLGE